MKVRIHRFEIIFFLILLTITGLAIHKKIMINGFVMYDKLEHVLLGYVFGLGVKQFNTKTKPWMNAIIFAIGFEIVWGFIGSIVGNKSIGELSLTDGFKFFDEALDAISGFSGYIFSNYWNKLKKN